MHGLRMTPLTIRPSWGACSFHVVQTSLHLGSICRGAGRPLGWPSLSAQALATLQLYSTAEIGHWNESGNKVVAREAVTGVGQEFAQVTGPLTGPGVYLWLGGLISKKIKAVIGPMSAFVLLRFWDFHHWFADHGFRLSATFTRSTRSRLHVTYTPLYVTLLQITPLLAEPEQPVHSAAGAVGAELAEPELPEQPVHSPAGAEPAERQTVQADGPGASAAAALQATPSRRAPKPSRGSPGRSRAMGGPTESLHMWAAEVRNT